MIIRITDVRDTMEGDTVTKIALLGDSILKGVQVDGETKRYITRNDMGLSALEAEFGFSIRSDAHFGATVLKGERLLDRILQRETDCKAVIMDFGGNDCDHCWAEIAADPTGEHAPKVELPEFTEHYRAIVRRLRREGIMPVLTTLPPLIAGRFLDWWCRDLDRSAVYRWLGDLGNIYAYQERYSRAVEQLAREEQVPLIDLRGAFLAHERLENLICEDGTHPNSAGQALIGKALRSFASGWTGLAQTT